VVQRPGDRWPVALRLGIGTFVCCSTSSCWAVHLGCSFLPAFVGGYIDQLLGHRTLRLYDCVICLNSACTMVWALCSLILVAVSATCSVRRCSMASGRLENPLSITTTRRTSPTSWSSAPGARFAGRL